jgi:hypothetical protein
MPTKVACARPLIVLEAAVAARCVCLEGRARGQQNTSEAKRGSLSESLAVVVRFRASRIRTLLQNGVTICGQVEKDSFGYVRALI